MLQKVRRICFIIKSTFLQQYSKPWRMSSPSNNFQKHKIHLYEKNNRMTSSASWNDSSCLVSVDFWLVMCTQSVGGECETQMCMPYFKATMLNSNSNWSKPWVLVTHGFEHSTSVVFLPGDHYLFLLVVPGVVQHLLDLIVKLCQSMVVLDAKKTVSAEK